MTKILFAVWLLASTLAVGQACAYQIKLTNFGFCLTDSGTLAPSSLSIGSDTPLVEGWDAIIWDADGGRGGAVNYPGLGLGMGEPAVVAQPHGVGTLPIIFKWGYHPSAVTPFYSFIETVTANAAARTISFKHTVRDCGTSLQSCAWNGYIHRSLGNVQAYFGSTLGSQIVYIYSGITLAGCGVAVDINHVIGTVSSCSGGVLPATMQQGAIYAQSQWFQTHNSSFSWTATYGFF